MFTNYVLRDLNNEKNVKIFQTQACFVNLLYGMTYDKFEKNSKLRLEIGLPSNDEISKSRKVFNFNKYSKEQVEYYLKYLSDFFNKEIKLSDKNELGEDFNIISFEFDPINYSNSYKIRSKDQLIYYFIRSLYERDTNNPDLESNYIELFFEYIEKGYNIFNANIISNFIVSNVTMLKPNIHSIQYNFIKKNINDEQLLEIIKRLKNDNFNFNLFFNQYNNENSIKFKEMNYSNLKKNEENFTLKKRKEFFEKQYEQ